MKYYIAYGSNLNTEQMRWRCSTARKLTVGEIKDYRLEFRGKKESAVATIVPSKGNVVPVLVWKIERSDEKSLDRYEGFPYLYRKESIKIEADGKSLTAMAYVMNESYDIGMPSDYYLNTILEGYEEAGFDTNILMDAVTLSENLCQKENMKMDL